MKMPLGFLLKLKHDFNIERKCKNFYPYLKKSEERITLEKHILPLYFTILIYAFNYTLPFY